MRNYYLLLSVSFLLLQMTGCTSRSQPGNRANDLSGQTFTSHVALIDQQGLGKLIHERKGKYLLLNIWATWCQPCVEEFPDLIRLAQTDTLVEVVGVSVDYPDEIQTKVQPFLERLKVPFQVYVARMDHQEDFISAVDTSWNGAIPATYLYDGSGRKKFSHVGMGSIELFERKIEEIRNDQNSKTLAKDRGIKPS
ncbi:MAG: TlpA family protein disulfide reductase [Ignavibacteriae bacterium]|nr:MAG: TlpA family protein disulfide reductase [Ignavibacteriota bacterium]